MTTTMDYRIVRFRTFPCIPVHSLRRLAAPALLAAGLYATPAPASDWGCTVLLCLASPASPTQYAACRPPIRDLWRHLATGGAFPSCDFGGAPGVSMRRGRDRYQPCPESYEELPAGFRPLDQEDRPGRRGGSGRRWCARADLAQICASGDRGQRGYERCESRYLHAPAPRPKPCWIEVEIPGHEVSRFWYAARRCG